MDTGPVLISDLGQVLLRFDVERAWRSLIPSFSYIQPDLRQRVSDLFTRSGFGAGAVSGAEFHASLCEELGLCMSLQEFARAWSDMFWVDEEVIDLVRRARFRGRYVLSNTNELHWDFIIENYSPVLAHFDHLLTSHELRLEKPDPEIYRWVMRHTGAEASDHFFIDDLEPNVEAARALGWDAVIHQDAAGLRQALTERGLLD